MRATVSQLMRLGLVVSELATMEVRPSNRNKIACEHKAVCAAVGDVHEAHPELISADLCCHQRHQERFKVSAVLLLELSSEAAFGCRLIILVSSGHHQSLTDALTQRF